MLEKMGWKKGEGLGKDGGGMKTPVRLEISFILYSCNGYIYCTYYMPGVALSARSIVASKKRHNYYLCGNHSYQIYVFMMCFVLFLKFLGRLLEFFPSSDQDSECYFLSQKFFCAFQLFLMTSLLCLVLTCKSNHSVTLRTGRLCTSWRICCRFKIQSM